MKRKLTAAFLFALPALPAWSQCTATIDSDDFSSASAWTSVGAGNVFISSGTCLFNAAADGVYDRIWRPLNATISDTYFHAEFDFTITSNPSGHGVGTNLMALSAGTLDPISYDVSQSYAATNQDGLIAMLSSPTTSDNTIGNWQLGLYSKDGATGTSQPNPILLNAAVLTYYVVMERTSATTVVLSAYTDAAHQNLYGSQSSVIPASITGLNTLHHGVTTWGYQLRQFNGFVDNVMICDNSIESGACARIVDTDDYSNSAPWTSTGAGFVSVSGGACTFNAASDAVYDRVYRPLSSTISDTYFKAEFKFTIGANPAGHGVGTDLLSLCAGTLDPISYDASQSYATTNQDGLIVLLNSASTTDNNINNWYLVLYTKDGSTGAAGTTTIPLSASILTYYVVLERTTTGTATLSAYSDAAHLNLVGTAAYTIPATITGLNTLHNGVATWGYQSRQFTGTVDDVTICDDIVDGISVQGDGSGYSIFPNPSEGGAVTINFGDHHPESIRVYDAIGQLVTEQAPGSASQVSLQLPKGFYLIVVSDEKRDYSFRQVVH